MWQAEIFAPPAVRRQAGGHPPEGIVCIKDPPVEVPRDGDIAQGVMNFTDDRKAIRKRVGSIALLRREKPPQSGALSRYAAGFKKSDKRGDSQNPGECAKGQPTATPGAEPQGKARTRGHCHPQLANGPPFCRKVPWVPSRRNSECLIGIAAATHRGS